MRKISFALALLALMSFVNINAWSQSDVLVPNPNYKNAHPSPEYTVPKVQMNQGTRVPRETDAVNVYTTTRTTGITYTPIVGNTISSWRNAADIDDNLSNNLPVGFPLVYNGVRVDSFRVGTSGFVTFNTTSPATGGTTGAYSWDNTTFSVANGSVNTLAVMFDDLASTGLNNITYETSGSVGSRVLTVQWSNMAYFLNATPNLNFQVKIYESDGHIEYIYGSMTPGTATYSYTCGINAATLSAVPTAAQLKTQTTANTNTFGSTAVSNLATVPTANSMISFGVPAQTAPNSPTGLNFTNVSTTTLTLNWTDNSSNETEFPVYISSDGGATYTYIGAAAANATSVNITGLTGATTYFFEIYAANETKFSTSAASGNVTTATPVPLNGAYTINPGGGGFPNFLSFTAAATYLAGNGVSGPVVFTVTGGTYSEAPVFGPIAGVSSTNTVRFQGPVSDARVVISATGTSAVNNPGIALIGTDWTIWENIDVTDAGTSTANQIEYGYLLQTNTAADGATNNTITGANILLGGSGSAPGFSHGVLQSTLAGATASNNNNKYLNLTIDRSDRGVGVFGLTAPALPTEDNIEISNCILGATTPIGDALTGTSGSPIGIIISNGKDFKINNNLVASVRATSTTSTSGPLGISGQNSTGLMYNNTIKEVFSANPTSTTPRCVGIQASGLTSGTQVVYNNFISGVSRAYTGAASSVIQAVGIRSTQQGGGGVVNYYHNSVYMSAANPVTYSSAGWASFAGGVIMGVSNNIFFNNISTTSATAKSFAVNEANVANTFYVANNNDLYAPGTNGHVGLKGTATFCIDMAAWRTATGQDANSVSVNVNFVNAAAGDLHLTGASNGDWNLSSTPIGGITTDIDGNVRSSIAPYKGADEGTISVVRVLNLAMAFQSSACTSDTITVEIRSSTAPYNLIESRKGLGGSGISQVINFALVPVGTPVYIVIKHRNAIQTWSGSTPSFVAGSLTYDFTSAATQAFGSNMILVGSDWSLYQGDPNQDETIDIGDIVLIYNDAANFVSGYVNTDQNCDEFVDVNDIGIAYNNSINFVSVIRP